MISAWMTEAAQELGVELDGTPTGFPEPGDDQPPTLDGSAWPCFPVDEAERLRVEHPEVWALGGAVLGERQFRRLSVIAARGGAPESDAECAAVLLREAWARRHYQDRTLAGVIAQVKWCVVGALGLAGMKNTIAAAIAEESKMQKREMPEYVTCGLVIEKAASDSEDGWCVVTSTRADRVDDVVDLAGLDITEFLANPIGLWQHEHDEPICTWELKHGMSASGAPALLGKPTFAAGDAVPEARKAEALWTQKIVRAVSIGFRPLEGTPRMNLASDHPFYKKDSWGYYYAKSRLIEVSLVSVPANPDAVRSARSAPLASLTFDIVAELEKAVEADPGVRKRIAAALFDGDAETEPANAADWLAAAFNGD